MVLSSPLLASSPPSRLTCSDCTVPRCSWRIIRHFPLLTSHQRMHPSLPPLISTSPFGLHASANTLSACSPKRWIISPLSTSQTKSSPPLLPPPPLAKRFPSGLHAIRTTALWCCCHRARST